MLCRIYNYIFHFSANVSGWTYCVCVYVFFFLFFFTICLYSCFVFQLDMLCKVGLVEKAQETISAGTEKFPDSVNLWRRRLKLQIANLEPVEQLQKTLKQAQNLVSPKVVMNVLFFSTWSKS